MSNHFHLAVEALNIEDLSRYVGSVCALYSRRWHKARGGGRRPLWQGRFRSVVVQKVGYMDRLGRYIERNPLAAKAAGVNCPEGYEWSSSAAYILGREDALVDVGAHPHWASWGADEVARRAFYAKHLSCPDDEAAKLFGGRGAVIGDDEFILQKFSRNGRPIDRRPVGQKPIIIV